MSGSWAVVTKRSKPRRKPVSKRTPVGKPDDLTTGQSVIFDVLTDAYPTPLSCEDILERVVKLKEWDTQEAGWFSLHCTVEQVWEIMDNKLHVFCSCKNNTYVLLTTD